MMLGKEDGGMLKEQKECIKHYKTKKSITKTKRQLE